MYFSYATEGKNKRYDLIFSNGEIIEEITSADLNVKFFLTVFEPWDLTFDLEDFLSYQISHTPFERKDFINHVRHILPILKKTQYENRDFTDEQVDIHNRLVSWLDAERKELKEVEKKSDMTHLSKPQLTLLFKFFFEHLEKTSGAKVSRSDIAKLLHIITNTKFTTIQNSTFTDLLNKGIYSERSEAQSAQNLLLIAKEFERVELKKHIQLVQQELKSTSAEIERVNNVHKSGPKKKIG